MKRIIAAAGLTLVIGFLCAQTPAPAPAFEVASIRPAAPPSQETVRSGQFHRGTNIDAARLDFGYVSLFELLPWAFHVKPYQVIAPAWTRDSRWNILATLPDGTPQDQTPAMMRSLLADRFKLTFHVEKREQQTYELTVALGGPKVEQSKPGETFKTWDGSFPGFRFAAGLLRGGQEITGRIVDQPNCNMRWEFLPLSMSTFADALTMFLNKPVVDETALKGDYKVVLEINVDTMTAINQNMAAANGLPAPGGGGGGGGGGGRGRGGDGGGGGREGGGQPPQAPPKI